MCTTCGCGSEGITVTRNGESEHEHSHEHVHVHVQHLDSHDGDTRRIQVEQDLLSKNAGYAAANRRYFSELGAFAVNMMSSPGSGKTTLLVNTVAALRNQYPIAVVEGDQQTSHDAERIRAAGVPGIQINTGKGCHLDAHMVGHALQHLALQRESVVFIENVGNLVCPAAFDLGEHRKVVIISVTEGEDKPLKYPDMFAAADLMIVNKIDLLPHVDFDTARCLEYARRVRPGIESLELSATSGEGLEAWCAWIKAEHAAASVPARNTAAANTT